MLVGDLGTNGSITTFEYLIIQNVKEINFTVKSITQFTSALPM